MNFLIVHGVEGYPEKNWYGAMARWLTARGHNVIMPQFPTRVPLDEPFSPKFPDGVPQELTSYDGQTLPVWLRIAKGALKDWDPEETILIGHSLGGALVYNLVAELGQEKPFRAAFLIAPVGGALDCVNIDPSFYANTDWAKAKSGAKEYKIFGCPTDAVIPFKQTVGLSQKLGAELIKIENAGHINGDSGYHDLPHLWTYLDKATSNWPTRFLPRYAGQGSPQPAS